MRWYETIIAAHTAVTNSVSHSERLQSDRYFVWQEDGSADLEADNSRVCKAITGYTELFTKVEFDPWVDELSASLTDYGVFWAITYMNYEEETGFYHIEWTWEVIDEVQNGL